LLVAERLADRIHVAGRVHRGVEPQRVAVLLLAAVDELGVGLLLQRLLLRSVRCRVDVQVLILELVRYAADAVRSIDTAWVEADQIERLEPERRDHRRPADGDVVEAGSTRAAGVEQHRAFAAIRGQDGHEGKR
jgi:hypothetical protein